MDITTVNDRHLYDGRVVVRDPADPAGRVEMAERTVRFGPAGWLTVVHNMSADAEIELCPTSRVLSVSGLPGVGGAAPQASTDH